MTLADEDTNSIRTNQRQCGNASDLVAKTVTNVIYVNEVKKITWSVVPLAMFFFTKPGILCQKLGMTCILNETKSKQDFGRNKDDLQEKHDTN